MRFEIEEEVVTHGRKKEVNYAVRDTLLDKVIVRYNSKQECETLLLKYQTMGGSSDSQA